MESLTLEQAYYIGELVAVTVVIVSLIYVGRQIKQNTEAIQVNAAQAFVEAYNTFTADLSTSEENTDIWYRGSTHYRIYRNK